jgi:predicted DNA-binding protein (MmcQ/YjbR family)
MAEARARTIPAAVRDLCLAFPCVEEIESHGMPAFRVSQGARKGKFFAYFSLNHHGNGHVALWLNTPALEQSRLIASSKDIFKPQYVGPSGWIGVELNRGFSWKRLAELVREAYVNSSPKTAVAVLGKTPAVAPPTKKMTPAEIDRLKSPRALKMLSTLRKICLALPETTEGTSFGAITWRAGKKTFASLSDYGKGLTLSFWTGIERQGPLEMDPRLSIPPYLGHAGWMAMDLSMGASAEEIREFVVESWRHFATRRALTVWGLAPKGVLGPIPKTRVSRTSRARTR